MNLPLYVFDLANNHGGSVSHGLKIIKQVGAVCRNFNFNFGFKFQYRHLPTFIHPHYKTDFTYKYVKRFTETTLPRDAFKLLLQEVKNQGLIPICTPFDETSVDDVIEDDFDLIKIASCSFTDWPLLEKIVSTNKPVIASTAGASLEEIDRVVNFFTHRNKEFAIMHCVAAYPTDNEDVQLNQIDILKRRYPNIPIGLSSHESPVSTGSVALAIAKGAEIFERHVGALIDNKLGSLNDYSLDYKELESWLICAEMAYEMCGYADQRIAYTNINELKSLKGLRRGAWASRDIPKGTRVTEQDVFFAIPLQDTQITANDFSKYTEFRTMADIKKDQPLVESNISKVDYQPKIYEIRQRVLRLIKRSGVPIPSHLDLEISHHYGIDRFNEYGCVIINFINRAYCKKLIIVVAGQKHPEQYHKVKEETFHIVYGSVELELDGVTRNYTSGDIVTVEPGTKHSFSSFDGAVIEEISSTHDKADSFYTDP